MLFQPLRLPGLFIVTEEPKIDDRGEFSRIYCSEIFSRNGLISDFKQINRSFSKAKGTLRGLHFQINEHKEAKYIRVIRGRIFDVAVDTRKESSSYLDWVGIELDSNSYSGIYLSPGFAHGILTLEENTEIEYLVSKPFSIENERGFRWDDPRIGIAWPIKPTVLSEKDQKWKMIDE